MQTFSFGRGVLVAGALIVGIIIGYVAGNSNGYKRAEAERTKVEEAAVEKVATDAAKAANPFQAVNPLEQVEANPFEKAKKVLNPFE